MKKAKQARIRTPRRSGPLAFLALLLTLAFCVAPASAYETHLPLPFSPLTGAGSGITVQAAGDLTVDETNGNVFLHEPLGEAASKVSLLGAEGAAPAGLLAPFQITGLNGLAANSLSMQYSGLAVDNSPDSPNKGTLYVSESGPAASKRKVRKFVRSAITEKYEPVGELKATTDASKGFKAFEAPVGVAVDSKGNVFVADGGSTTSAVVKFSPTGTQLASYSTSNLKTTNPSGGSNFYVPLSIDVNSSGDLFVVVWREGATGNPVTKVVKYPADEAGEIDVADRDVFYEEGSIGDIVNSKNARAVAVDPLTDTLYVALQNTVVQYDSDTLEKEGEFGLGAFEPNITISSLAVNGATGRIYVSENGPFGGGPRKVNVFGPGVKLPTVEPKAPTKVIGPRATLNAVVNPEGLPVTACKFEYGTTASYGNIAPCEGSIGADGNDYPVTAALTGLTPGGVDYHWRLVVSNANGTNDSMEDRTFKSGPPVATDPATAVTGAKATLNGTVLPLSLAVTECKFEYGLTIAYGLNKPCVEAVPTDNGEHAVSADVDSLLANGATYHFRIVTNGGAGLLQGNDETLVTADRYFTKPAEAVGNSATLNGTVNLEGVPLTDCEFEYGQTKAYGSSAPCSPSFSSIPTDSTDHAVTGALTGLEANSPYHFRLVAKNALGEIVGDDGEFETTGAPLIADQSAAPLGVDRAALSGYVNPVGFATTYHFEWGLDTSYGQRMPAGPDPSIGAGAAPVAVSQELAGLSEDTTYHYRIVAENSAGSSEGPDQTFTTDRAAGSCSNDDLRSEQISSANPDGTAYLPNCMALEMVSPPKKFNQKTDSPDFSLSGDAVQFISLAALAGTPQLGSQYDPYVAARTGSGWKTHAVQPPPDVSYGDAPPCSYDLELASWNLLARPGVGAKDLGIVEPMSGALGGGFSPLGPTATPTNAGFDYAGCEASVGSSADGSAFFFRAEDAVYLPGDPLTTAKLLSTRSHTYVAFLDDDGDPTLELLSRDASGTQYGRTCGADVGGVGVGTGVRFSTRGAISFDGSRVYFTTRPGQADGKCNPSVNRMRIMKRIQTPSGPEVSELISSECNRVAPACSPADGDDNFMAASQEGDEVFFMTTRQLANSDLDTGAANGCQASPATGCDLYLYDASRPVGSRLTQVSAGDVTNPTPGDGAQVLQVGDVAGDGSHVYFVARGLLTTDPNSQGARPKVGQPNLYLYQRDAAHPGGRTAFIATLGTGEASQADGPGRNRMAAVPRLGSDVTDLSVGGDGHVLFFSSKASLVPGDTDGRLDGYRYDASTGSLQRITRAAPGGVDNGAFDADGLFTTGTGRAPQDVSFRRTVSEDGRTAVFMTKEGLDPSDQDAETNVYVWRDGRVTAIAGSLAAERGNTFTVSSSGESVAFVSEMKLLPFDVDGAKDVYVARADGGFLPPPPPEICEGENCQAPFNSPPPAPIPPSATIVDPGNLPPAPPKCRKGFVRKHGKCVKKKGAHKKAQKRHANTNRRAGK